MSLISVFWYQNFNIINLNLFCLYDVCMLLGRLRFFFTVSWIIFTTFFSWIFSSFSTVVLFRLTPEFPFLLHNMPLNNFCTPFKIVLQILPSDLYRTKENTVIMRKISLWYYGINMILLLFGENNYKLSKVIAFSYLVSHLHKNWDIHGKIAFKKAWNECGENTADVETVESLQRCEKVFYYRPECYLILKLCETEDTLYQNTCNYFM